MISMSKNQIMFLKTAPNKIVTFIGNSAEISKMSPTEVLAFVRSEAERLFQEQKNEVEK